MASKHICNIYIVPFCTIFVVFIVFMAKLPESTFMFIATQKITISIKNLPYLYIYTARKYG